MFYKAANRRMDGATKRAHFVLRERLEAKPYGMRRRDLMVGMHKRNGDILGGHPQLKPFSKKLSERDEDLWLKFFDS